MALTTCAVGRLRVEPPAQGAGLSNGTMTMKEREFPLSLSYEPLYLTGYP